MTSFTTSTLNYPSGSPTPIKRVIAQRAPLTTDNKNFIPGDEWLDEPSQDWWKYVTAPAGVALWVRIGGTAAAIETITGDSGGAVPPNASNNLNLLGAAGQIVVAGNAGTNTLTLSLNGAIAQQYVTDSGTAIPAANSLNVLGGPGVTTSGAGSTITINSVVFTDTAATTLVSDNGYNATAAGTYALPATATQGQLIILFADTAGAVVLDAPALNFIRIGSLITSSGGTATSTLQGDSLTLRYRLSSLTWEATSVIGTWIIA